MSRTGLLREAVCDTGPIIHLAEVGLSDALHVARRLTVPAAVADEVRAQPRGPGTSTLRQAHVHVVRPSDDEMAFAQDVQGRRLGLADRSALAMAHARECPLFTDDLDLRDAARRLDVEVAGTVGIILRAAHTGLVDGKDAHRGLEALLESSMFITKPLVARARAALDNVG